MILYIGTWVHTTNDPSNRGACAFVCPECPLGQLAFCSAGRCGCLERRRREAATRSASGSGRV